MMCLQPAPHLPPSVPSASNRIPPATLLPLAGQPDAPTIRAADGLLDSATVQFDAVQFAVSYGLRLLRCTGTTAASCTKQAGAKPSEPAAGLHTFAGIATPGLYTLEVTATAANGVASDPSTTPILLVGKPGQVLPPSGPTVAPGVGNATFGWLAPVTNPDPTGVVDATRYTLRVYDTGGTTLISSQALSGLGGEGTVAAPFTKLVTLIAGGCPAGWGGGDRCCRWPVPPCACVCASSMQLKHAAIPDAAKLHCCTGTAAIPTAHTPPAPPLPLIRRQVEGHHRGLQQARRGPRVRPVG